MSATYGKGIVLGGAGLNFKVYDGVNEPALRQENDIWVNTDTPVKYWSFSEDAPCRVSNNKNMIVRPFKYGNLPGTAASWQDLKDGTIVALVTSTVNTTVPEYTLVENLTLSRGTYTLSGCQANTDPNDPKWWIEIRWAYPSEDTIHVMKDTGEGVTFDITQDVVNATITLHMGMGVTDTDVLFQPQLEKGSTATAFVKGDATGQVWFKLGWGSTVTFNALRRNGVTLAPTGCMQWVDEAWTPKVAKSYHGSWVGWKTYLFRQAHGGLPSHVSVKENGETTGLYGIWYGTDGATLRWATNKDVGNCIYFAPAIDLTGYNELVVELQCSARFSNSYTVTVGVGYEPVLGYGNPGEMVASVQASWNTTERKTYRVDVSKLQGLHYVKVGGYRTTGTIYNCWLE